MKKSITVIFAAFLVFFLYGSTFVAAQLAEGEYTVEIKGLEIDSDSTHLRGADLVSPARIVVQSNTIEVYFSSQGRELTFQNSSGGFENKTVSTTENDNGEVRSDGMNVSTIRNYKVDISSLDDELIARFPAGGSPTGSLTYRIVFDAASLEPAGAAEETPAPTSTPQATATPDPSPSQDAATPSPSPSQNSATPNPSPSQNAVASESSTPQATATSGSDASESPATSEPDITEDEAAEQEADTSEEANGDVVETASDIAVEAPNSSSSTLLVVIILVVVAIAAAAIVVIRKKR